MVEVWAMGLSPPCRAVLLTAKAVGVDVNVNEVDLFKGKAIELSIKAIPYGPYIIQHNA